MTDNIKESIFHKIGAKKLHILLTISRLKSVNKACEPLDRTYSALYREIKSMEKQVGFPLVEEKTRNQGLQLTAKGELFCHHVQEVVDFLNRCQENLNNIDKKTIHILVSKPLDKYLFNHLLSNYQPSHSFIEYCIRSSDDIHNSKTEVMLGNYTSQTSNLHEENLCTLQKQLFASQNYLQERGMPQSVDDLIHHRLIACSVVESHSNQSFDWILTLGKDGKQTHIPFFVDDNLEIQIEQAIQGIGIVSCYAEFSVIQNSPLIKVLPNIAGDDLKINFLCRSEQQDDPDIINLKEYLKAQLTVLQTRF